MTNIFYVTVWSIPIDYAARREKSIVGYHKTRKGAEERIKWLKENKDYGVYYGDAEIQMVPLHD